LVEVEGACESPVDGAGGGRFGFAGALRVGAVWARASVAEKLRTAARQSERSIRSTPGKRKRRARVARAAQWGQGEETLQTAPARVECEG
jgi:hypothetical protein